MSQQTIENNQKLAEKIKSRRIELKMTIEEAAKKANVGTKTWYRYETGESIRKDKYKGICKALNWNELPFVQIDNVPVFDIYYYKHHKSWSPWIEEHFGEIAAISFIIGSEILGDHINEDMLELAKKPHGTHVGELSISFLADILPPQFLTKYNYEFLYVLNCTLQKLICLAENNESIIAHSVMEELVLYLIVEESRMLIEEDHKPEENWDEWIFDLFEDDDIRIFLYGNIYLTSNDTYHFDLWMEKQFYIN